MRILRSREDGELLLFIRQWVRVVADGDLGMANSWLADPWEEPGVSLNDVLVRFCRGSRTRDPEQDGWNVTDPETMDKQGEEFDTWEFERRDANGETIVGAEYRLPIDGSWSDVYLTFAFRPVLGSDGYAAHLMNIRPQ